MTLHSYRRALELQRADEPFDALVMAAMLKADTSNIAKLRECWPELHAELDHRYHAPSGLLPGEPGRAELDAAREAAGLPPAGGGDGV